MKIIQIRSKLGFCKKIANSAKNGQNYAMSSSFGLRKGLKMFDEILGKSSFSLNRLTWNQPAVSMMGHCMIG